MVVVKNIINDGTCRRNYLAILWYTLSSFRLNPFILLRVLLFILTIIASVCNKIRCTTLLIYISSYNCGQPQIYNFILKHCSDLGLDFNLDTFVDFDRQSRFQRQVTSTLKTGAAPQHQQNLSIQLRNSFVTCTKYIKTKHHAFL